MTFSALVSGVLVGSAVSMAAQTASPAATPLIQAEPKILNFDALAEQGKVLLEKADGGNASITLSSYPGYHTMLTVRRKSGGGELHTNYADFMFVVAGEGTELVGGTMVDAKEGANGEVRGTRLDGATAHILRKGDVIHIPSGIPHQSVLAPGQTITIFVIKVEEPAK
jgi:mannose-6-phosphate isomerase-like protein (cupin superfamily)